MTTFSIILLLVLIGTSTLIYIVGRSHGHDAAFDKANASRREELEAADERRIVDAILTRKAIARAELIRGAPHEPAGMVLNRPNWPVIAAEIKLGSRYAAAAIAYAQSSSKLFREQSPERRGLAFALWWHGYDPDDPPCSELDETWDHARTAPVLHTLATIERAHDQRVAVQDRGDTLEDETIASS